MFNIETYLRRAGDKNTNILLLLAITLLIMNSPTTSYQEKHAENLEVEIV